MTDADLKPYVPNDEFNRQLSDLKDQAENVCQCCGHRADLAPVVKPLIWREDAGDELAHNGLGWLYRITWANDPEVGFLLYRHESSGKTRLDATTDPNLSNTGAGKTVVKDAGSNTGGVHGVDDGAGTGVSGVGGKPEAGEVTAHNAQVADAIPEPASGPAHHGSATSENEAIKQCQADYKHRILSAIDMAPVARKHLSAEEAMAVTKDQYTNTLKYLSDGGDASELLMTRAKSEPEEPMSNPGDKDYEV